MKARKLELLTVATLLIATACSNSQTQEDVEVNNTMTSTKTEENSTEDNKQDLDTVVKNKDDDSNNDRATTDNVVRLTTTTSVNDSGLMEYLRDELKNDTGLEMEIVSKGTGAAIEDAKQGNADVILVHSKSAEEEFIDEGFGVERKPFMYNYFVIVGPTSDPAGIKGKDAEEAFKLINDTNSTFVSRGDDSGTHKKEVKIWEASGVNIDDLEVKEFYNSLGDGMGATLTFASENGGYTLTDLATYLTMKDKLDLEVLVDQSESLKNVYSVIIVNPDKVSGTNVSNAEKFQEWMLSDRAAELISEYGVDEYGEQLFFIGQ